MHATAVETKKGTRSVAVSVLRSIRARDAHPQNRNSRIMQIAAERWGKGGGCTPWFSIQVAFRGIKNPGPEGDGSESLRSSGINELTVLFRVAVVVVVGKLVDVFCACF